MSKWCTAARPWRPRTMSPASCRRPNFYSSRTHRTNSFRPSVPAWGRWTCAELPELAKARWLLCRDRALFFLFRGNVKLLPIEVLEDHLHRAVDGPLVLTHHRLRVLAQLFPPLLIRQQLAQCLLQFQRILDLDGAVFGQEVSDHFREILHIGSEDHRLAQCARFNGILAPLRGDALANEDNRGLLVKVHQFTGRIDQQGL